MVGINSALPLSAQASHSKTSPQHKIVNLSSETQTPYQFPEIMPKVEGEWDEDPKTFKLSTSKEHLEKNLAMTLASYDTQPTVKMYNILMREKVKEMSGTYPEDIEAKWASRVSLKSD